MSLLLTIGRNSNGEIRAIDLVTLPHLFISYSETNQLEDCLRSLSLIGGTEHPLTWYLAVDSSRSVLFEAKADGFNTIENFYRDDPMLGTIPTRGLFIKALHTELTLRKKKKTVAKEIIIVMDDIWDMVIHQDKQTGKRLLMLLTEGHKQGIHLVVASPTSYRNLLLQIMQNGKTNKKAEGDFDMYNKGITTLGAEIVFTPDNLVFYRERGSRDIQRFYWV